KYKGKPYSSIFRMKSTDQFTFRLRNIKWRTVALGQCGNEKDNIYHYKMRGLKNIPGQYPAYFGDVPKSKEETIFLRQHTLLESDFVQIKRLGNHDCGNQGKPNRYFVRNHLCNSTN